MESKKIRPNKKKEFSKLDEFNLGVVRCMTHQFYARSKSLADIYFFNPIHAGGGAAESAP